MPSITRIVALALTGLLGVSLVAAIPTDTGPQAVLDTDLDTGVPLHPVRDALIAHDVIGDVLDDFLPTYIVDISYPKSHETVQLGNNISVKAVSKRPVFTFHSLHSASTSAHNASFTLALTDPDAKSRDHPIWSEMCHWIVTNLTIPTPGALLHPVEAKAGELEEYLPPSPPPRTGSHRYVFVLLEGDTSNLEAPSDRKHWGYDKARHGVRDWAKEFDLTVVGANFFYAQDKKQ